MNIKPTNIPASIQQKSAKARYKASIQQKSAEANAKASTKVSTQQRSAEASAKASAEASTKYVDDLSKDELSKDDTSDSSEDSEDSTNVNIIDPCESKCLVDNSLMLKSVTLTPVPVAFLNHSLPVSVAESVTAGALSNTICSEPGSSKFFLGGIVAYNMITQKNLLHVDAEYAEKNNFANPFTTYTMAKNVAGLFNSRIGLSTTGYSLPLYREADPEAGKCEINVTTPYAYICLYDSKKDTHVIYKIINNDYLIGGDQRVQRAQMQSMVALECKKVFDKYCRSIETTDRSSTPLPKAVTKAGIARAS